MIQAAYIHIPFCTQICHYCDFNKVFLKGQPVEQYLNSLDQEMIQTLQANPASNLKTIFIGGGTPTALSGEQLVILMKSVHKNLKINSETEFSIEANPGDLTLEKLKILKEFGVNRLSIGVQTFNDTLLERIGRSHRALDVYTTIENAKACGFSNISVDLMYGLPGQTIDDVEYALDEVFKLDIQHTSAYSLIVEPKTIFYNLMNKGKLRLPSEDLEADMYDLIMNRMHEQGFQQYEISNYAKPGFESRHNLVYWDNDYYYGFGAGAHGYLNGNRHSNIGPINKYIQTIKNGELPIREKLNVTKKEQMEEEMFLGLRKNMGVSIQTFKQKFGEDPLQVYEKAIDEMRNKHLLEIEGDFIRLTSEGRFIGNEVFQEFLIS